jgi:hypothetical protein
MRGFVTVPEFFYNACSIGIHWLGITGCVAKNFVARSSLRYFVDLDIVSNDREDGGFFSVLSETGFRKLR